MGQYQHAMTIQFHDEDEEQWNEMLRQELRKTEHARLLNPEGYADPIDSNVMIYPERRDREPWTEHLELRMLDAIPNTKAQEKRGTSTQRTRNKSITTKISKKQTTRNGKPETEIQEKQKDSKNNQAKHPR